MSVSSKVNHIKDGLRSISPVRWVSYILFIVSGLILVTSLYLVLSINVLKNWNVEVTNSNPIYPGNVLILKSTAEKTASVHGDVTRYLECRNKDGLYIRYARTTGKADRGVGPQTVTVPFTIPTNIPELPATCRIFISVDYTLFLWKHTNETALSREFVLMPLVEASQVESPQMGQQQQTSQAPSKEAVPSNIPSSYVSPSSSNSTPVQIDNQQTISQPTESPVQDQTCVLNALGIKLLCS